MTVTYFNPLSKRGNDESTQSKRTKESLRRNRYLQSFKAHSHRILSDYQEKQRNLIAEKAGRHHLVK